MKGIVFTEFLEMIEDKYGYIVVDQLLTESNLPSGGTYTAIGTYDHSEMVTLVSNLSQKAQIPVSELLRSYGRYMFVTFTRSYRPFVDYSHSAFDLLKSIQHYIHVEVKKLYPDAELPHFTVEQPSDNQLHMYYESERKLSDFAHGLIEGCLAHFGEKAIIRKTNLVDDGSRVFFEIVKE
ncbi:heme NO-binding domain-containing protein [Spirosoma oryzicola]|uniref:heme NO-binding domain-containing protein n=1 Tax=Spirosoma oryzicola TaxID=2898794 RepID=UPI001E31C08D|nr:heme NO-binding domain-containing protein [Spirosoma oryzicola]UHG89242.1 heme NO-binding domain-containing protein [Spirosoma oryzicola]